MYDQTVKRRGMHESTGSRRSLVPAPEEPGTASAEPDEVLVADLRGGRTPSQAVAYKLDGLLAAAAHRALGEGGRAEDARHLLGRGPSAAPGDATPGIPPEGEGAVEAL
jgi:hypothetical protein